MRCLWGMPENGGLRDSGQNEDRPFGLQHRLGYLIRVWRYQVDVRACGMSVEQHIVEKFGFLIGRVVAPDRDNPLKRPNIEARRLDLGLEVLQPVLEAFDLVQYVPKTLGKGGQLFGRGHRLPCCVALEFGEHEENPARHGSAQGSGCIQVTETKANLRGEN